MRLSKAWIIILSSLTVVVTVLPIIRFGLKGVFYTIDPDVQYLSNSFTYIEKAQIQYDGHPGTPTIILLAYALWPLRVYVRLATEMPFMTWVFQHADITYFYIRIFQSLWLGLAMAVFLWAILRYTKSVAACLFAWAGLFVYSIFPYLGSTIVPETTSFFITVVWLFIFSVSNKSISTIKVLFLAAISGLASANKFSNITLVFLSFALVGFIPKVNIIQRLKILLGTILVTVVVFIISTWSIRNTYPNLFRWVSILATTTGTHGGGEKSIFDLTAYLKSVSSLLHQDYWPAWITAATSVWLLVSIVKWKQKLITPLTIAFIIVMGGIIIFAKYPLSHYQLVNYTLVLFVASALLTRTSRLLANVIPVVLLPMVFTNLSYYTQSSTKAMINTARLEEYVRRHPASRGTLWEWARVSDFSFLWGRDWAGGTFDKELSQYRPDLLAITSDMEKIKINNRELKEVFDVCWDKFYIQTVSAPVFMTKYADRSLKYSLLPGIEDISIIESDHCQK